MIIEARSFSRAASGRQSAVAHMRLWPTAAIATRLQPPECSSHPRRPRIHPRIRLLGPRMIPLSFFLLSLFIVFSLVHLVARSIFLSSGSLPGTPSTWLLLWTVCILMSTPCPASAGESPDASYTHAMQCDAGTRCLVPLHSDTPLPAIDSSLTCPPVSFRSISIACWGTMTTIPVLRRLRAVPASFSSSRVACVP